VGWLLLEKLPLLALSVGDCILTIWALGTAIVNSEWLTLSWRLRSIPITYVTYLGKFFYPVGLAVVYPRQHSDLLPWKVTIASIILVAITVGVFWARRRCPYLLVGWLWYLILLAPVSGFLQIGAVSIADRFTYLPQIGLVMALTLGAADLCRNWPQRRWICGIVGGGVLTVSMAVAFHQTTFWCDSETLWNRALDCTPDNCIAHNNLGDLQLARGQLESAATHFREALKLTPKSAVIQYNMGRVLHASEQWDDAEKHLKLAIEYNPRYLAAYDLLGNVQLQRGRPKEAVETLKKAYDLHPNHPQVCYDLGKAMRAAGQKKEAAAVLQQAETLLPDYAEHHDRFGLMMASRQQMSVALEHFQKAVDAKPDSILFRLHLATALGKMRRFAKAIDQCEAVLKIDPKNDEARNMLEQLRKASKSPQTLDASAKMPK
jgi:tetratricopeptide (TPR) repeat protein